MRYLWVLIILLALTAGGGAAGNGPQLMDLTNFLLKISEEGVWQPQAGWQAWDLDRRDRLKTVIYNGRGAVAAVDWSFEVGPNGWAKVSKMGQRVPKVARPLLPGKYYLAIEVNGEMSWGTDFRVRQIEYQGASHFEISGPWKSLAYAYTHEGLVLCYWMEGPRDLRWFDPRSYEAKVTVSSEVVRRNQVIISKEKLGSLSIKPGGLVSGAFLVADAQELARLTDGDYELRLLVRSEESERGPWPVVGLKLPIRDQKVEPNPVLSGPDSEPTTRYPANAIYYGSNIYSLDSMPGYFERR